MTTSYSYPQARGSDAEDVQGVIDFYRSAPDDEPAISLVWARNRISEAQSVFGQFRRQCDEADRFYDVEFDFSVPKGASKVKLPTFRVSIDTAASQLSSGFLDITVAPRRLGFEGSAEKMERFLHNAHVGLNNRYPLFNRLILHLLKYGVAFRKIEVDTDQYWHLPEYDPAKGDTAAARREYRQGIEEILDRQDSQFPFRAELVDPREVVWDTASSEPRWFMVTKPVDARWLQANYPDWKSDKGFTDGTVQLTEIWTHNQVAYIAEDIWVMRPRRHRYGMIPVVMYDAGLSGTTLTRRPDVLFRGAGYGKYDLLNAQSKMVSTMLDITRRAAYPPLMFLGGTEKAAAETMRNFITGPGAHVHIPRNMSVEPSPSPPHPPGLFESLGAISELINTAIFTNVSSMAPQNGPSSGYQTAVLQGISSLTLTPVKNGLERGIQRTNELVLRTVENVIQRPVSVFGDDARGRSIARLRPNEINGHYYTAVSLKADSPNEEERLVNLWSRAWQIGLVDAQTALRNMGQSQPSEILVRREVENLRNSPQFRAALEQWYLTQRFPFLVEALQATGATNEAAQLEAVADQVAQNVLATQGATQLPNAGNFGPGNQAGTNPATPGSGVPGTTRPVIPGSAEEADLVARQLALSPGGTRTTAGQRLPAAVP